MDIKILNIKNLIEIKSQNFITKYIRLKKLLLIIFYIGLLPFIFFIFKYFKFKKYKICLLDSKFGQTLPYIEGFLVSKKYFNFEELEANKIIFLLNFKECNSQIIKMISKKVSVYNFNFLFKLFIKTLKFWKLDNIFIDISQKYPIKMLLLKQKKNLYKFYKKNIIDFTNEEIDLGKKYLRSFNLKDCDQWICIANRDQNFKTKMFKEFDWDYHKYRNFSVHDFNSAIDYFLSKGFYVFRMGYLPEEKLNFNNTKVIDYANSQYKNDFLDVYLLRNCKFYFGGDTGPTDIAYNFMRPAFGVNFSSTLINISRSYIPWLFTIKRIKDLKTGKLLTLKEILLSNFAFSSRYDDFRASSVEPISNTDEEIGLFAEEVLKDINNEKYETNEDLINQRKFWDIYYDIVPAAKIEQIQPKISPVFLRKNIDLLN